jgi:hypothetical protein
MDQRRGDRPLGRNASGGAGPDGAGRRLRQAPPDQSGAARPARRPGGLFVFTVNHPCFEQLWSTWRAHGEYRLSEYLAEYEIDGPHGTDFHRPLSTYLNELIGLGCRLRHIAEPGLDPAVAATGPAGIESYTRLPNFLIVSAES